MNIGQLIQTLSELIEQNPEAIDTEVYVAIEGTSVKIQPIISFKYLLKTETFTGRYNTIDEAITVGDMCLARNKNEIGKITKILHIDTDRG